LRIPLLLIIEELNKNVALLLNKILNNEEKIIYNKCFQEHLKNNENNEYVVNLDDAWVIIGFVNRDKAKNFLLKNFKADLDYIMTFEEKENIMMTVQTMRKFYMKADTDKSHKFCDFYIKLENIIHQIISAKNKI